MSAIQIGGSDNPTLRAATSRKFDPSCHVYQMEYPPIYIYIYIVDIE